MRRTTALASTAAALVAGAFAIGAAGAHAAATSAQTSTGGQGAVPAATSSPTPTSTTPTAKPTPTPVSLATATPTSTPVATPTAKPTPPPLFATPEAAMAYMARAFDARDITALKKVTTPQSRQELFDMWPGQVHLRLSRCEKDGDSYAYVCFFPHDPPKGMDPTAVPEAVMVVEPAARPGWYMSELSECG
jgi:hypothetical protein